MLAFARTAIRALQTAFKSGHYSANEAFKRILPKARALAMTFASPDAVIKASGEYTIGHTQLSSADLPYEIVVDHLANISAMDISCYTSGIINIGTYDKYIAFRYKYLVSLVSTVHCCFVSHPLSPLQHPLQLYSFAY